MLCSICSEAIFNKAYTKENEMQIRGIHISYIRYQDNTSLKKYRDVYLMNGNYEKLSRLANYNTKGLSITRILFERTGSVGRRKLS